MARLIVWTFPAGLGAQEVEPASRILHSSWTYQLAVKGTGTVTAGATVQVRNVPGGPWTDLGTLSASGTGEASDSIASSAPWSEHRVRLDSLNGTNAVATIAAAGNGN